MKILKWPVFITASAVVVALLMTHGCAGSDEKPEAMGDAVARQIRLMQAAVVNTVADPERREKLLVLIDELGQTFEQHVSDFEIHSKEFQSLYHDYETTNDTLEEKIHAFKELRESQRDRVLELHFKMVALTTAAEWQEITNHELTTLETGTLIPSTEKEG